MNVMREAQRRHGALFFFFFFFEKSGVEQVEKPSRESREREIELLKVSIVLLNDFIRVVNSRCLNVICLIICCSIIITFIKQTLFILYLCSNKLDIYISYCRQV